MKQVKSLKFALDANDDTVKKFIIQNSEYSRFVWNKFVEKFGNSSIFDLSFKDVDSFKKEFYYDYEVPNKVYDTFTIGISEQVCKNIKNSIKSLRGLYKNGHNVKGFNFHKKDFYRGSFKVHNLAYWSNPKYVEPILNRRLRIINDHEVSFRVRKGCNMVFTTKEPIYNKISNGKHKTHIYYNESRQCKFSDEDIKEVIFSHECNRIYIILVVQVSYDLEETEKELMCGIDLGVRNPIMLYRKKKSGKNKDEFFKFVMPDKTLKRIYYLERRAVRLQKIMDMKRAINEKRVMMGDIPTIYSKNYVRILRKFRLTWRHIACIKKKWRESVSKYIASSYKIIVVDPISVNKFTKSRRINRSNTFYGMRDMMYNLENSCKKEGSILVQAPRYSTRTCSECMHVNAKIPVWNRVFKCEKCGYSIGRDENSARFGFNAIYPIWRDITESIC